MYNLRGSITESDRYLFNNRQNCENHLDLLEYKIQFRALFVTSKRLKLIKCIKHKSIILKSRSALLVGTRKIRKNTQFFE